MATSPCTATTPLPIVFTASSKVFLLRPRIATLAPASCSRLAAAPRLRIFEAVSATSQMTCGEIVSMRGVTPATVSHHLKVLSEAKLITCSREGQFVYSQAVPETIAAYTGALAKIAGGGKAKRRR